MNRKGFTLVELLTCLVLMGAILGIGLYVTKDTLSASFSTLTDVSESQIYDAAKSYILENEITWINKDNEEYTCVTINDLIHTGYFEDSEIVSYKDDVVKVVRKSDTRVISGIMLVDVCE